ncbi:MAG: hypothetical protein A3G38_00525 [Omnitrophica WOR_2 bacterium RIFCSPLOWO2_12_FULL_51_8]|nr:MAG: hypothetical protein A3G38_00525 [Omnitrophica WOR_2 bacterium RIFCSPLOWO2_12_FULL_51_8]
MTSIKEIEKLLSNHKQDIQGEFKVKEIGIFGSWVRGEQKKRSDIDILVDFDEIPSFLKFMALEEFLSEILGKRVDLVMKSALKPVIGRRISSGVNYVITENILFGQ